MPNLSNLRALPRVYKYSLSSLQIHVQNTKISAFGRAGNLKAARKVFDEMSERDVVSWNAILTAHWKNRDLEGSKRVFDAIPERDILSWNSIITGCIENAEPEQAFEYFASMPERNIASWNAMLCGFLRYGCFDKAERLFRDMPEKNVISYTAMVDGYMRHKEFKKAHELFDKMPKRNAVSWAVMVSGYVENDMFDDAKKLFDLMPQKNLVACTAMITGYCKKGMVACARKIFGLIQDKDTVSWNAMLAGYAQNGHFEEALKLHIQMVQAGVKPDHATLISSLTACSSLALLQQGRIIHAIAIKTMLNSYTPLCNALITMYSKCGSMNDSELVFCGIRCRGLVSYNTIIAAYAQHGNYLNVITFFKEMEQNGIDPDETTFLGLLSACGHVGKVKDSLKWFDLMVSKYNLTPQSEHYGCIVDILSRSGELEKASTYIKKMSNTAENAGWGSLLGACKTHSNVELGELAANNILKLDSQSSGAYVMLSNIYASAGMWGAVNKVRRLMREKGVKKLPGYSWLEIGKKVHWFTVGDVSHPEMEDIVGELHRVTSHMKLCKEVDVGLELD
ncbi:Pentatricopeptide repeat-containing protein [Rhynchospora pubera]|uniref:Pentatricopeptide repeat-containing protein n=1 Tax=Rhynchospora pubera TaxID=906938 RepID=A0AAV8H552_9POAL|nr:Pentatricopeptide repeat-containing protein [Rhynchospora pubera]